MMNVWSKQSLAIATQAVTKAQSKDTCTLLDHTVLIAGNDGYKFV